MNQGAEAKAAWWAEDIRGGWEVFKEGPHVESFTEEEWKTLGGIVESFEIHSQSRGAMNHSANTKKKLEKHMRDGLVVDGYEEGDEGETGCAWKV